MCAFGCWLFRVCVTVGSIAAAVIVLELISNYAYGLVVYREFRRPRGTDTHRPMARPISRREVLRRLDTLKKDVDSGATS